MERQPITKNISPKLALDPPVADEIIASVGNIADEYRNFFLQHRLPLLNDLLAELTGKIGKQNFLVFKNNKYVNVLTENIAFFYVKYEAIMIMCFDKKEYFVNYSLDQIQGLLPERQFYRLNRQYLINFNAVKEVEHYFARKLLVMPTVPFSDKLIVSKDKVSEFFSWLENR